jgi:glucan biosynthesis protein C
MKERRYDIDWLRVIAMLSVFIFHSTRFFCTTDWHIKVPVDQQSDVLGIVRAFLFNAWFMELFCLVSGFAAWYALKKRTGGQFLVERVKRLLIPLYTVGMFILVVPRIISKTTHMGRQRLLSGNGCPATIVNFQDVFLISPVTIMRTR